MAYQPLSPRTHLIFWTAATITFIAFIMLFKSVLFPFVLGIAIAYLLNPLVNKLGNIGFSRAPAAMMILLGFVIIILTITLLLAPVLVRELTELAQNMPGYIKNVIEQVKPLIERAQAMLGITEDQAITKILENGGGPAIKTFNVIFQNLVAGGQAVVDAMSIVVITPIVAYFMMKDWPAVTSWVHDLIPRHAEKDANSLLKKIDEKIAGFVRGQISVAVMLGIGYAVTLAIVGLKYGMLIGLASGLLSVIPMVGSAVGLIVSISVAWFQTMDITFVLIVGGIFLAGQVIEGNFLTPKLVGDSVGLHPLWVFFALVAGGSLLGILGMFLSVPVTASIGVITSFLLQKYKDSQYYTDINPVESVPEKKKPEKSEPSEKKTEKQSATKAKTGIKTNKNTSEKKSKKDSTNTD